MTKRPNRLGMYADVQQILDAALASEGGEYTLSTYGKAVHWRQRAYKFRKLYAEVHHAKSISPYDSLMMPRVEEGSSTVHIIMRQLDGEFKPNKEPTEQAPIGDDDLLDIAQDFADKLEE